MMVSQMKRTGILRRQSSKRYLKRAIRQSRLRRRDRQLRSDSLLHIEVWQLRQILLLFSCLKIAADSASLLLRVRQILLCYPRVAACSLFRVTFPSVAAYLMQSPWGRQDRSPLLVSEATGHRLEADNYTLFTLRKTRGCNRA